MIPFLFQLAFGIITKMPYYILSDSKKQMFFAGISAENIRFLRARRILPISGVDFSMDGVYFNMDIFLSITHNLGAAACRFRPPGKVRPIMKAVISVIGKDTVGIIAKVSAECARCGVNILDISQTVLQDYFTMIMITDIDGITVPFPDFVDAMTRIGSANNLKILTMHEDIFNTMHKI